MELESIKSQTVLPDKVIVYIAEGYDRPNFQVGKEIYVWVKKGMVAQRVLDYKEIDSEVIFFLDDDVILEPDSAEKMLVAMEDHGVEALGTDLFGCYKWKKRLKAYNILVNLDYPHKSKKWAFKIHSNGSFSYNINPHKNFYLSQKCEGPAWMIKRNVYDKIRLCDEIWLDKMGFAYSDDTLETYKIHCNGFRIGVLYNAGIHHTDAGVASKPYRNSPDRIYIRSKAIFMFWWRAIYLTSNHYFVKHLKVISAFIFKMLWTFALMSILSVKRLSISPLKQFLYGLRDGWNEVHATTFRSLKPYILSKR